MRHEEYGQRLKRLIVVLSAVIISGCAAKVPDIIQVGDCEHGIVSEKNLSDVRKIWTESQRTDVLISGGCYQSRFIKKDR